MAAPDGRVPDNGFTERERFKGEGPLGVGAVAVGDLVAAASFMAAGIVVEAVADGGGAGDAGVGGGTGRVEKRVGLVVALVARLALYPHDVTAGVDYHVLVSWRAPEAYSDEILSAPFLRARHHVRPESLAFVFIIVVSVGGIFANKF